MVFYTFSLNKGCPRKLHLAQSVIVACMEENDIAIEAIKALPNNITREDIKERFYQIRCFQ